MKHPIRRWSRAWRGGLAALTAICVEDLTADRIGWLPHLSTDTHIDLIALAFLAIMWGGLSEFRAKAITPVKQSFEYGWRLRGEVEEQRQWAEREEAHVLRLPVAAALRATSGSYPTVSPLIPRGRAEARHRRPPLN